MTTPDRKIYFAGSIGAGRRDQPLYQQIIEELKGNYGMVLTEFVGDPNTTDEGDRWKEYGSAKSIHDDDIELLEQCHYLIAEVTQPSHGVGYEIGRAKAMGKNILCLLQIGREPRLSLMLNGALNDVTFVIKDYKTIEDVRVILKEYFTTRQ